MTLSQETGEFFLNNPESPYCLFAYRGDSAFLERMETLFHNFGILISGEIHKIKDNFHYILTPLNRLKDGLKECFRAEIITDKTSLINKRFPEALDLDGNIISREIEWDVRKVEELVEIRLKEFLAKVSTEFVTIYLRGENVNSEYSLGKID